MKSCKIEKVAHFTHFEQKNTHISGCKIVHLCTIATVTVHICTITVTLLSIILYFFSLLSLALLDSLSPTLQCQEEEEEEEEADHHN